jgi:prevent-host-death family protein
MPKSVTPREIQKSYRKIFNEVKETSEPVIVMKNNKPDVAIISISHLESIASKTNNQQAPSPRNALKKLYGMWKGRKDWKGKEGYEIVRELRSRRLKRIYGKK